MPSKFYSSLKKYRQEYNSKSVEEIVSYAADQFKDTLDVSSWKVDSKSLSQGQEPQLDPKAAVNIKANTVLVNALTLVQQGLEVRGNPEDGTKDLANPFIYMQIGGRIMITYDANDKNFFERFIGGVKQDVTSTKYHSEDAIKENKAIFKRTASTHELKWDEQKGEFEEIKTRGIFKAIRNLADEYSQKYPNLIPLKNFIHNIIPEPTFEEYGMVIASGGLGNQDILGNKIDITGGHGHILIHHQKPDIAKGIPGGIMIGIETAEHGSKSQSQPFGKHSSLGHANEFSSFGIGKMKDLAKKIVKESANIAAPQSKYNCMRVDLTKEQNKELAKNFDNVGKKYQEEVQQVLKSGVGKAAGFLNNLLKTFSKPINIETRKEFKDTCINSVPKSLPPRKVSRKMQPITEVSAKINKDFPPQDQEKLDKLKNDLGKMVKRRENNVHSSPAAMNPQVKKRSNTIT
ncbi:hypothetical protein [Rickettsiales endosymbiont of Stachyamoeba lipophora]|uniref:hypothetical protein n=1 Tax=Rickettsiales endosymbiont of Stachyamoeba lipophora TaxID=2486578 RepID=UPI000F652627|nr:hypothetical protein [Rickettsiales endosymbiont of Stachyamoeba lipophora]AZL15126.1 hypothetical protein EF513_00920 [Rickettsiales endosymbiont of Stachyamoeba lipophora]